MKASPDYEQRSARNSLIVINWKQIVHPVGPIILGTKWVSGFNVTPQPLFHQQRTPVLI
jgi:hypothetical protein